MNKILSLFFAALLFLPTFVSAQDKKEEAVLFIEDTYGRFYQKATVQNLSKLYWQKGALDIRNNKVIDNFVLINDCGLYEKYIIDDFKWEEVREATRKYIKSHVSEYSDRFKIIVPLDLGRFDSERQGFHLVNYTKMENMKRVKIGGKDEYVCGEAWAIPHYPKQALLVLNKPYSYDFVALEEDLAKDFIKRYNKTKPTIPLEFSEKTYGRPVFARIRMRFLEFQDVHKELYETPFAVMFGRIDGIDIFQNADETGLITSITYHEPDEEIVINQGDYPRSKKEVKDLFSDDAAGGVLNDSSKEKEVNVGQGKP